MLIIDTEINTIVIRKAITDDFDYYALILQHRATGQVFVFNVSSDTEDCNYFKFTIDMTGNPFGEYEFWIAGNSPNWILNIDEQNIRNSCYYDSTELVFLGARESVISARNEYDFAITIAGSGGGECRPLKFLHHCLLYYRLFSNYIAYNCCNYDIYEPEKCK